MVKQFMRRMGASVVAAAMSGPWALAQTEPTPPPSPPRSPALRPSQPGPGDQVNPALKPKPAATLFDSQTNVKDAIDAAVKRGASERRRVLVLWGINTSRWATRLQEQLAIPDTARLIRADYEVVAAEVGDAGLGPINLALAQTYGAKVLIERNMMPLVTVIETTGEKAGQAILNASTDGLIKPRSTRESGEYFPLKIQDFLIANRAVQPTGSQVVAAALADAKARSLPVFLYFMDREDPWCHRFDAWLKRPEVREVLDRHFVVTTVDMVRNEGAPGEFTRFGGDQAAAAPWYLVLDADATRLAPLADKGEHDLGYPTGEEAAAFVAMLRRVAPDLTDGDIRVLTNALAAAAPQPAAGGAGKQ
jgi:hypothetical protein